jgi:hypothetical protein
LIIVVPGSSFLISAMLEMLGLLPFRSEGECEKWRTYEEHGGVSTSNLEMEKGGENKADNSTRQEPLAHLRRAPALADLASISVTKT